MESLGRPASKNSSQKHENENANVVLGSGSSSTKCSREMDSSSATKYSREVDANEITEESEAPISEQPSTPIKEKEAAKALGPNVSPVTPWTVCSSQARDPHSGGSSNRAENPCSSTALEQDMGFTFAPNESGKSVETCLNEALSDASINLSTSGSRRDQRSQPVRCLRFNASAGTVHAPVSAYAGENGCALPRAALIFSSLQSNLGRVLQPHAESKEHCPNGALDDDRVSVVSKVSDIKHSGTRHFAKCSVSAEGFSIAKVSKGKRCDGTGNSANKGPVDEVRVSISDALREEAFLEETSISFLGAIVSEQYADAGLNPPNRGVGDDSSSVPTTPTTPSSGYISVPDTCPGAPMREGVRTRLPAGDLSAVRRKLQF